MVYKSFAKIQRKMDITNKINTFFVFLIRRLMLFDENILIL